MRPRTYKRYTRVRVEILDTLQMSPLRDRGRWRCTCSGVGGARWRCTRFGVCLYGVARMVRRRLGARARATARRVACERVRGACEWSFAEAFARALATGSTRARPRRANIIIIDVRADGVRVAPVAGASGARVDDAWRRVDVDDADNRRSRAGGGDWGVGDGAGCGDDVGVWD